MSNGNPPSESENPQPSIEYDAQMNLPSSYETNVPPDLEPPEPTNEQPELEEISPKDLIVNEIGEQNDPSKTTPEPPPIPPVTEMPENWKPNKIMRRADWGAVKPKWIKSLEVPVDKVVVSFTETDPCYTEEECQALVRKLQQEHMADENVPDIKHNFLIGGDEVIYEGRGYMRLGPTYKPSPKKIEELTGKSIDIAVIERSASKLSKGVVAAISFCFASAVNENSVSKDFTTYYVINGEINLVRPPISEENLSKETK